MLLYTLLISYVLAIDPVERALPSGYYLQETGDYIMQVNVNSKNSCIIEFGAKNFGAIYVVPDAPFIVEDSGRIVLFPSPPARHPVFEAMKIMLELSTKFPAYGQWYPSENRIEMRFNMDWNLHHVDVPIKIRDVIKPTEKGAGLYFFGVLYDIGKADAKLATIEAPKADDVKTAAKSVLIRSTVMASLLAGLALLI